MEPSSTAKVTTSSSATRRQSCDRCHGQKLRCTRTGDNNTGVCNRCLRQGTQCVYSFNLPKGRPSMYRVTTASSVPAAANTGAAATSSRPVTRLPPTPVRSVTSPLQEARNQQHHHHHQQHHSRDIQQDLQTAIDGHLHTINTGILKDTVTAPIDLENGLGSDHATSLLGPLWPWPDASDDLMILDSGDEPAPSTFGLHTLVDDAASLHQFDLAFDSNSNSNSNSTTCPPTPSQQHLSGSTAPSSSSSIPAAAIAELSQLTTRLHPLHHASRAIAEMMGTSVQAMDPTQARSCTLLDNATFQTVITWLIQVSAGKTPSIRMEPQASTVKPEGVASTLLDAFSSSRLLLSVLYSLPSEPKRSPIALPESAPTSSNAAHSGASYFEQLPARASHISLDPSGQYLNAVICPLVIACHTMLLSIYLAVLTPVQHQQDQRERHQSAAGHNPNQRLSDFRLALIVQFCSYFIEQQCQAVGSYMSKLTLTAKDLPIPDVPGFAAVPDGQGPMDMLETEVRQVISQLRHTMHF